MPALVHTSWVVSIQRLEAHATIHAIIPSKLNRAFMIYNNINRLPATMHFTCACFSSHDVGSYSAAMVKMLLDLDIPHRRARRVTIIESPNHTCT
jgi:hypothetical protein